MALRGLVVSRRAGNRRIYQKHTLHRAVQLPQLVLEREAVGPINLLVESQGCKMEFDDNPDAYAATWERLMLREASPESDAVRRGGVANSDAEAEDVTRDTYGVPFSAPVLSNAEERSANAERKAERHSRFDTSTAADLHGIGAADRSHDGWRCSSSGSSRSVNSNDPVCRTGRRWGPADRSRHAVTGAHRPTLKRTPGSGNSGTISRHD
jgi:hypothetical protein